MEESEQAGGDVRKVIRVGGQIPSSPAATMDHCITMACTLREMGAMGSLSRGVASALHLIDLSGYCVKIRPWGSKGRGREIN